MRPFPLFATILLATPLVAACSSDSGAKATPAAGSSGCEVQVSADLTSKPKVTVPACASKPTTLQSRDVVAGSGAAAGTGDAVSVQYVGLSWSTKRQFDASWDRGGEPFTVQPLGQAGVISGWNQGLMGAHPGSRRLLIIPPDLGYGARGAGGAIAPNETLIFVVDVLTVTH